MGIAGKYNKKRFDYTIPQDTGYISLEELFTKEGNGVVYNVHALYINSKGNYGDAPAAAIDGYIVNLPKHLLDTVNQMLNDDEFISAVNAGKVGFQIYPYESKNTPELCYSVNWIDL